MNQTRLAEVEDALIGRLKDKLNDVGDIAALTAGDFNDQDQLITGTPAIRVFFRTEQLDRRVTDQTATTYQSIQAWIVLCGAQSLRDFASERIDAQNITSRACDALAGFRPKMPSQEQGPQVVLKSVQLFQAGAGGSWYALEVHVESITQFGVN
jgi:phage gp37-like protein